MAQVVSVYMVLNAGLKSELIYIYCRLDIQQTSNSYIYKYTYISETNIVVEQLWLMSCIGVLTHFKNS